MRYFLTGFMGSGKSYLGRRLAQLAGYPFIDLDEAIVAATGQTIPHLFDLGGEGYFRALERDQLHQLVDQNPTLVLSCGGGTPCFYDNMAWMNQRGVTIFLDAGPDLLFQRLRSETAGRPLLQGKNEAELRQFLEDKLRERRPCYTQAQLTWPIVGNQSEQARVLFAHLQAQGLGPTAASGEAPLP